MTARPEATVFVASFNTAASTELCVRSAREHSALPFALVVGDGGSTDGTVDAVAPLVARGWLRVEQASGGRSHAQWLDHFLATCETPWAVFLDSDVELLEADWLAHLLDEARAAGAALAGPEVRREAVSVVEPVGLRRVRLAGRVEPWVMAVDVAAVRALATSFAFRADEGADVPEGVVAYDVGAAILQAALDRGLTVHRVAGFERFYRHYGGLSWVPVRGRRGLRKLRDAHRVRAHLAALRAGQGDARGRPPLVEVVLDALPPGPRRRVGRVMGNVRAARLTRDPVRFLARELVARGQAHAYRLRDGDVVVLRHATPDLPVLREFHEYRVYDPPAPVAAALDRLPTHASVLDLGAHIGLFGLWARRRLDRPRVTSFEPDPANAVVLRRTVAANGATEDAWSVRQAAAGASAGRALFRARWFAASRLTSDASDPDAVEVEVVDVLPLLASADVVKIDIEGGEWALLADPRFGACSARVLVLEFHPEACPGASPRDEARRALTAAGWQVHEGVDGLRDTGMLWAIRG